MDTKKINELKKTYGAVYELPIEDKKAYLRTPKMKDFKRAFSALQNGGDLAFDETLLNLLFIGGDEEIKINDNYFFPARKVLKEFFIYDDAEVIPEGRNTIIIIGEAKCKIRVIGRDDIKIAERKNPSNKAFVTQEKLFELVCIEKDDAFNDINDASIRMPLYQTLEKLQNEKIAIIKKL